MATTSINSVRTANDRTQSGTGLLLATAVGLLVGMIALATGAAVLLAGLTNGLGQFVLLAGGWLALVSASPALARRGAARIVARTNTLRAPRPNRAVQAIAAAILTR